MSTDSKPENADTKGPTTEADGDYVIIKGVRDDGKTFRPSDWIDRLAALGAEYGPDKRLRYSKELRATTIDGQKCLLVELKLKESNRSLYEMVVCFAEENRLSMQSGLSVEELEKDTCTIDPATGRPPRVQSTLSARELETDTCEIDPATGRPPV
jgi:hypothetical protein